MEATRAEKAGLGAHPTDGFGVISQNLQQQASLLAYNDIYRLLALASALCIPIFAAEEEWRKARRGALILSRV